MVDPVQLPTGPDFARLLDVVQRLSRFEAEQRLIRGMGAFSQEEIQELDVSGVMEWLAYAAERGPLAFESTPQAHVVLGRGEWVIGHTFYKGSPSIVFTPAIEPGEVGTEPKDFDVNVLQPGSVVMSFTTMESMLAHLDRMRDLGEMVQEAVKSVGGS